jgi:hypothetical protein
MAGLVPAMTILGDIADMIEQAPCENRRCFSASSSLIAWSPLCARDIRTQGRRAKRVAAEGGAPSAHP